ncbi:MAG: hypothetical protein IKQ07_08985 [Bacteroidaceae bacterium]|nr:hypothetical protein [Bacteroidaceae bacterium]
MNQLVKQYLGLALILIGAILLVVCRLAGWQSNTQLIISLSIIILGYFLHLWLQKHGEKY